MAIAEAECLSVLVAAETGVPVARGDLDAWQKGDPQKVLSTASVKSRTARLNESLASRRALNNLVAMNEPLHDLRRDSAGRKNLQKFENMLISNHLLYEHLYF